MREGERLRPPTSSQDDMASLVATPSLHGLLDSHLYQIHLPSSTSPATQRDASAALAGLETLRGRFGPHQYLVDSPTQNPSVSITSRHGTEVSKRFLSRLQMICIALRAEKAAEGMPPPGATHCPAM